TAYFVSQDAFVAPVILSPDSDIVLTNRLKMSELQVERARAVADLEGCEADLQAARAGLERLATLREGATKSRAWYADAAARQEQAASEEIRALAGQRAVLGEMVARQITLADRARNDLASALISRDDYAKEVRTLDQMYVAVFDNE